MITPSNTPYAFLPYITLPELNKIQRLMHPSMAMAAKAQPFFRIQKASSKRSRLQLEGMADRYGELVIIEHFLQFRKVPTLMDRSHRVRAVFEANYQALLGWSSFVDEAD